MTQAQPARYVARQRALDKLVAQRQHRRERDRRVEAHALAVLTALHQRDAAIQATELRAAEALRAMTDDEGLPLREVAFWFGGAVGLREVTRLRHLIVAQRADDEGGPDGPAA